MCLHVENFGDGTEDIVTEDSVVTHTYEESGVYDVLLRFTDNRGLTSGTVKSIEVPLPGPVESFLRGDPNADSAINIADAIFTLSYLFADGATPSCLDAADANDDGKIDIADAIAVLAYLFAGAGDLPEPFGECGIDPTVDELGCSSYGPCE